MRFKNIEYSVWTILRAKKYVSYITMCFYTYHSFLIISSFSSIYFCFFKFLTIKIE